MDWLDSSNREKNNSNISQIRRIEPDIVVMMLANYAALGSRTSDLCCEDLAVCDITRWHDSVAYTRNPAAWSYITSRRRRRLQRALTDSASHRPETDCIVELGSCRLLMLWLVPLLRLQSWQRLWCGRRERAESRPARLVDVALVIIYQTAWRPYLVVH